MFTRRSALFAAAVLSVSARASAVLAQDETIAGQPPAPPAVDDDPTLIALIAGPQRDPANAARDRWRHPLQSLDFWGLAPGLTVIDVDPGGGYWTEILAPYLAQGGGRYIAAMPGPDDASLPEGARQARAAFAAKFSNTRVFGQIGFVSFSAASGLMAPAASADMILATRVLHNLVRTPGLLDRDMGQFYAALRPGGVLAVEEHRADPRAMLPDASDGYMSEAAVIDPAQRAGFVLSDRSEVNANPRDSKDHPFGVWTLPPTRRSAPEGQPPDPAFDHAKYDAIGESDRMTLRFAKPA